jgi:outer membrane protein OmpA-like peptidoglycan-associated protein
MPGEENISVASNFGFEPGTKVFFEDDFSTDAIGDFPAKWDTNSSGEIFGINGEKWLKLTNDATLIASIANNLPENYTIEFDMLTSGLDERTRSTAMVELWFDDNGTFEKGKNKAIIEISPYQAMASKGAIEKYMNGTRNMRSYVGRDYREEIKGQSHFSIEVNGPRVRIWINTMKIIDVPRLIPEVGITNFKIFTRWLRDNPGEDEVFVRNFRFAETGEDLRSKLLKEGGFSTNEIQFDSGSSNISASSMTILNQIGQLLSEESSLALKIVGHTDADGSEEGNLQLSEQRAEAVKRFFSTQFGIDTARLETEGKGESQPVVPNDTPEHKAQNRRVEFIKQ